MLGFDYLINEHQRIYWLYLLSALLLSALFIHQHKTYKTVLFDKNIWLHPSAKLDYIFFFIAYIIKVLIIVPLLFSASEVTMWTIKLIREFASYHEPLSWNKTSITLLYTFTLFMLSDLTRYWLHRLMHLIPFLWKIHRVHHSALVLTPITYYRVHPLESFLFGLRYALSAGVVSGVFIYFFGARLGMSQILGVNAFIFVYSILGANLRHSHIPFRFGNMVEKVFISPYMHQIHHSKEGVNKNFGGVLSIWDGLFGSREIKKIERLEFGLKEHEDKTLLSLFFLPFR